MKVLNWAVGTDDFAELIQFKHPYIDKTLWIKELFEDGSKVALFPRPRRFGKTLNMSMLKYFLDVQENYGHLFGGLAVTKYPEIMAHQGKYPVIFLSLKEIKSETMNTAQEKFAKKMHELFSDYRYLRETLNPDEQQDFDRILHKTATLSDLGFCVQQLSKWLEKHHGQKVWILIDEYDTPIQEAWLRGYYDEMISFMRVFLGAALKGNTSLYKGILTGILRVSKEGMFSDLNNLTVYSMLSKAYGQYFGFTEVEVDDICKAAELTDQREAVRNWYNGYRFGELDIYNPLTSEFFLHRKSKNLFNINMLVSFRYNKFPTLV